jgi:tetratricopeptide (TPR) repeat protein
VFGQTALDDAKKEIDKENYIKAKNILLKLIGDGSSDVREVSYYLGNAYLRSDDADSAKVFYRMVGGAENKTALGLLAYGRLNLLNGDLKAAKDYFEKASIKSNMKNATILYQAGDALFKPTTTDLAEAIRYFEDAYKLDNKNYINMLELGDAYLANNEGGKALSKYESAAELYPKLTLAFIKIGRLNVNGRIYDDAINAYKKAIALEPDYALAHKELAEAYYLSKKFDLAKPEFQRYIELNKDDADAKTKFLMFLFQIKEYDQCASEAQKMLLDDPTNYIILRAIYYSDYELKRYKEGMEIAQRFWVAAPVSKVRPFDYVETAKLATKTGDTTVALKYFTTALAVDTNNGDLLSDYGQLMYNTKRYQEAIANYTKKINRFPNGTTFYDFYYLGRANYAIALSFKSKKEDAAAKDSATAYFVLADTAFARLLPKYASTPDVWQWRAKANNNLDAEMKNGSAKPYYEQFIAVATKTADPTKYKNFLIESYQYLGAYFLNAKDTGAARGWLEKAKELDPLNETTLELLKGL